MENKTTVAILCGGRSPEHRISLLSASSVIQHIDRKQYDVIVIAISKSGIWHLHGDQLEVDFAGDANRIALKNEGKPQVLFSQNYGRHTFIDVHNQIEVAKVDVLFPILHGEYGEDGAIQGLAKMAGIPCVGCGILGSSVCMDKDTTKRLLRDSDIKVADFITVRNSQNSTPSYEEIRRKLGDILFIKPANLGSSVGVSCARNEEQYDAALTEAFKYDNKVIIEEQIIGREIECAVIGNEHIEASPIGEIVPKSGIYTFESKYVDDDGAALMIPADLPSDISKRARNIAIETYRCLDCKGMARVDMFYTQDGDLVLNEVNTIPGFTSISMYPKLWMEAGLTYPELIGKLIALSQEEFAEASSHQVATI